MINQLIGHGRCGCNFKSVIYIYIYIYIKLRVHISNSFCEIDLIWMPQNPKGDRSALVQAMAWCRLTVSHYLHQCWSKSSTQYDATRPEGDTENQSIRYIIGCLFDDDSLNSDSTDHLFKRKWCLCRTWKMVCASKITWTLFKLCFLNYILWIISLNDMGSLK